MPDPEVLGRVINAQITERKDGSHDLELTVKFTSDETMAKAIRIIENMDRVLANLWDDRFEVGVATKDFYDGP